MKQILFSMLLMGATTGMAQSTVAAQPDQKADTGKAKQVYQYIEQMPLAGYDVKMFLQEHLRYPEDARQYNVQGKVMTKFCVTETGVIEDVKILKGVSPSCDSEARRVVESMPPWKPGRQKGNPIRVYFTLPISFILDNDTATAKPSGTAPAQRQTPGAIPFVYEKVEQMPESTVDLKEYISAHLYYPTLSRVMGVQGTVITRFIVNEDGSLSDIKIIKGVDKSCDEEAIKVIKGMPAWKPGKKDNKPVPVYVTLLIDFTNK